MSTILQAGNATSGAVVSSDTAGSLQIQTGSSPTTAITVDTSQNVGIATTTPAYKLDVAGTIRGRGDAYLGFISGSQAGVWWSQTNYAAPAFQGLTSAGNVGDIVMQPGGGNLLLASTTNSLSSRVFVNTTNGQDCFGVRGTSSGAGFRYDTTANTGNAAYFTTNSNTQYAGGITISGNTTSFNSASDYRLKENVSPMQNALNVVQQLKPVTFTWKPDGANGQGFIAHELQEVVPDCVTGEKDAVDADGKPKYQGVDTSFLVATLTAAIQELNAKVDAQAAEIQALKGVA